MAANSVAHGGEVKFQVFKEWDYHHFLKVTNTCRTKLKTCNFYAMDWVPDEKWCFCFYFHMATYFMCCNGLYRNEDQIKSDLTMEVFLSLHSIQDNAIAKKITTAIRKYLPVSLSKESKNKFSSRSLRQGAITKLSMHSAITLVQACAQSGHSTKTSLDSYILTRKCSKDITHSKCLTPAAQRLCKSSAPTAGVLGGWHFPSNWVLHESNVHYLHSRIPARQ